MNFIIQLPVKIYAQKVEKIEAFVTFYNNENYKKALDIINIRLKNEYSNRIEYHKIPTSFITIKNIEKDVDLKEIFRKRKEKGFFIEENRTLFQLHFYAGKCLFKQNKLNDSLNHFYQSLRFKKLEYKKDDKIFYEISQINRKKNNFNGYIDALETAYTLDPDNPKYSHEIGMALSRTKKKKKSIFHLERYINSSSGINDPKVYLILGNLNEDIGKYLKTEKYYKKYLKEKPDDSYIHYALGFIAYKRTGNYPLAISSLNKSLKKLPEKEIYRRSKAFEYKGEMSYSNLNFQMAIQHYLKTIKYQEKVLNSIKKIDTQLKKLNDKLSKLKATLIANKDFDDYETYEFLQKEKGEIEYKKVKINDQYKRLNPGKVRWNIADSYNRIGNLNEAIKYYREAIYFNYKSNRARKKIKKLKLIIKRGY